MSGPRTPRDAFEIFQSEFMDTNECYSDAESDISDLVNDKVREQNDCSAMDSQVMANLLASMQGVMQQNSRIMEEMVRQNAAASARNENHQVGGNGAAVPNFHVMPDLSKTIDTFNGEKDPAEAQRWLKRVETTALLHSWPDAFKYESASSRLDGAARNWFNGREEELNDWGSFRAAFTKMFVGTPSKTETWNQMQQRKQTMGESVSAYFHDKLRLCRPLGVSFDEIKEQIVLGLRSRELRLFIRARVHADEDVLFKDVVAYDRAEKTSEKQFDKPPESVDVTGKGFQDKNVKIRRDESESPVNEIKRESSVDHSSYKCYNCDKVGHISANCSEARRERKCLKCGEIGHTQKYCSKPKPLLVDADMKTIDSWCIDPSLEKFLKKICVNGQEYQCMVDPGSSACTVKASVVLADELPIVRRANSLRGFGNKNNVVLSCGFVQAQIVIDGVTATDVQLRIVPDDVQNYDIIIGRSFTELPQVVYYKVDGNLIFVPRKKMPFELHPETESRDASQPIVHGSNELAPASVNFLQARVNNEVTPTPVLSLDSRTQIIMDGYTVSNSVAVTKRNYDEIKPNDIIIDVTSDQREEIHQRSNEFRMVVANDVLESGKIDKLEMDIMSKPGSFPVKSRHYKASVSERANKIKIYAIKKFPTPQKVHDLRRFCGLTSFFCRLVRDFTVITEPLTKLFKKDTPFIWSVEQENAFTKVKLILSSKSVLAIHNPKASRSELHTDASSMGLTTILIQDDGVGNFHPVYAIIRRTSSIERHYHSSKLGLLTVVWAIDSRLRIFLIALKFVIITDVQALVYLNSHRTINPRVVRWSKALGEYDFSIYHRPGVKMRHVDALSRVSDGEPVEEFGEGELFNIIDREDEISLF